MKIALILCGGIGSRLWPKSTSQEPKQFLNLYNDSESLLDQTISRFYDNCIIYLVTNKEYMNFFNNPKYNKYNILYESDRKNTGVSILQSCLFIKDKYKTDNINIVVVPSDHYMEKNQFNYYMDIGFNYLLNFPNKILTFGIKPKYAEIGYGYIEFNNDKDYIHDIVKFHEKPDILTAEKYVISNNYLWNSGIFIFNLKYMIDEYQLHANKLYNILINTQFNYENNQNIILPMNVDDYQFDKIIMEKTNNGKVIKYNGVWSDIGDWNRLHDLLDKDGNGNFINKDINIENVQNSYINVDTDNVLIMGLKNVVVVKNNNNILISDKDHINLVNKYINNMNDITNRPWGYYKTLSIDNKIGYQVKYICVYPGKRLSLQYHNYRSENWVIVQGTGIVTLDDEKINVNKEDSVYIKIKQKHRIENTGDINLIFIETQIGSYLGEDDIVRIEDDFNRI